MSDHPIILSLEGNIGAGKSTFLNILDNSQFQNNYKVFAEPVGVWQDIGNGINLLDMLYKDTRRWASTFQSFAFLSRLKQFDQVLMTNDYPICITERSIETDKNIFAKNFLCQELMDSMEMQVYQSFYKQLMEARNKKVDGFIYLQTSPEVCQKRCMKRARSEESSISLEYLQQLHQRHQEWLNNEDIPVLFIDTDQEFENNEYNKQNLINQFQQFLQKIVDNKYKDGELKIRQLKCVQDVLQNVNL